MMQRKLLSLIVLSLLLFMHSVSWSGVHYGCKTKLEALLDPYTRALVLSEPDRDLLSAQSLRLFEPLKQMQEVLQTSDPTAKAKNLLSEISRKDLRIRAFQFEAAITSGAQAKILKKQGYGELFKRALKASGALRFETGLYTDSLALASDLKDIDENGGGADISTPFRDRLAQEVKKGSKRYAHFLEDNGWVGENRDSLKLMQNAITALHSLSETEDLKTIKMSMLSYIDRSLINEEFDMTNLEGGIHPLRRHLRWLAITIQTLNLFKLFSPDDDATHIDTTASIPKPQKIFPKDSIGAKDKKYVDFGIVGTNSRFVYIDRATFEYLTRFISELGVCKSIGQRIERFSKIYRAIGEAPTKELAFIKAQRLSSYHSQDRSLAKAHPQYANFKAAAEALYTELRNSGLLEELRLQIKNGIEARL